MAPFYTFSPKTTTISFSWPKEITGLERIALSAQGDLQRILSAFFARPISLALTYSHTFTRRSDGGLDPLILPNPAAIASASPESPIVQNRQVHLQCSGKIVCTATSTVKISSTRCAQLFLEEKYGIGQLFSKLGATPTFELLEVGVRGQNDANLIEKGFGRPQLWRKYKLSVPEIECEILEVFASREMFVQGESWLDGQRRQQLVIPSRTPTNKLLLLAFLSLLIFELYAYMSGSSRCLYVGSA
ncbi:hypothetical protein DFH08DRAFT_707752 [Mycena albidolilacea]|uniref:Uncharacterized protein n=1 Tax=Mycena albidolilacea TaxID=1033008 RepID=A0AAD7EK70_9AGAR|nr:hypothetical protein DFH08DRAFT_707752 [Mycena albidolilacea]